MRLVVAVNDRCTINRDGRRPMVRSIDNCILRPIVRAIVASCDRSYDQSWNPKTDSTINREVQRSVARIILASCRSIVRSIVATYDRSYDQSLHQTIWNRRLEGLNMPIGLATTDFALATSRRFFLRFSHDSNIFRSQVGRNLVASPV